MEFVFIVFTFGLSAGVIGKIKGGSFWIWFVIGFFLPVFGTLAALLYRNERGELLRHCEECGAVVALHNQVCMRCGRDLEFPQEP